MRRRRPPFTLLALLALALVACSPAGPTNFDEARQQGWLFAFLAVFAAGVMTSLTPCVYPMIPIVMGIFGARGESVSRARAVGLAGMYVLGMGVMYSALGLGAALTGRAFGAVMSNPWVIVPLVVFYAALAASMFGAFELNLPTSLQAKLASVGGKGGGGAFLMGLVGGLTAAPCTGPFLLGILAFVATTKNAPLGLSLLFTYALGMGVLFFILAAFAVSLPKSGAWMDGVKSIAGVALLVVGIYFLRPIVPELTRLTSPEPWFFATSALVALVGLVGGAVHLSFHERAAVKLRKGAMVALATLGLAGVINWILTPKNPLPWRHDEAAVLAEAREQGRPVLIDFGAEWCAPCKEYEVRVFSDPAVYAEVTSRYIPLKFDLTHPTDELDEAKDRWRAGLPTVILLRPDGTEHKRFTEPIPSPDEFLKALREIE